MKLTINKDKYRKEFAYNVLPKYILREVVSDIDDDKVKLINTNFNIDSKKVISFALENLNIIEDYNYYIIEIDKNLRFNNYPIESLINLITYGSRDVKGYPIVNDIFNFIAEYIDEIYEKWLGGII